MEELRTPVKLEAILVDGAETRRGHLPNSTTVTILVMQARIRQPEAS